jgi:hypothetical protein
MDFSDLTIDMGGPDTSSAWTDAAADSFVDVGEVVSDWGSSPSLFGGDNPISGAVSNYFGGSFDKITSGIANFWDGGGDKKQAAANRGLIGSVLQGAGAGYMQNKAQEKSLKVQIDAMREKQKADAKEREKYSSLPDDFAKNVNSRKTFGV